MGKRILISISYLSLLDQEFKWLKIIIQLQIGMEIALFYILMKIVWWLRLHI